MVNLLLLDLHDPCRSVWHVHGVGPGRERWAFQGESGTLSSLLGNDEAGLQKLEWLQQSWDSAACPAVPILCSRGAVDAELSIIPFHLWSVVELSPPPGCLGCVPWDSSVCADFNMQLAESGRLSADWEIILPRFTLWYILFWGTEQKTFNRVWLLGKPLWCHKCWHTSFRLSVIPQAMLCILPGGTWCTVLERGVKRKKRMDENIWDPILCSGISFGMTEVAAYLFSKPGYFRFQISHVDCCVFLNWFFYFTLPKWAVRMFSACPCVCESPSCNLHSAHTGMQFVYVDNVLLLAVVDVTDV